LAVACLWCSGLGGAVADPLVIDFEDVTLPAAGYTYGGPGSEDDGILQAVSLLSGSTAFATTITRWSSEDWWSGFAFSNQGNTSTAGWTNQYSSFAGSGYGGSGNFAIACQQAYDPDPLIVLPAGMKPVSLRLVNTTYTALTMRDGDIHNFSAHKYAAGDYLSVTFSGHATADGTGAATGAATFLLADFLNGNSTIVDAWTEFSLASLGDARSISIGFASSDVGEFGINTPTYVAIDNLAITAVPEPSGMALMLCGAGVAWAAGRRRPRASA
jgi:hypothetical protein